MIRSRKMKCAITTVAAAAIMCTASAFAADVTSTAAVNVRSGPGNSYSVLTTMAAGTTAEKLGEDRGWIQVSVNGRTGYVYSRYLTDSSSGYSSQTNVSSSNNVSGTVYITASALNVRSGAGTSYSVIGSLGRGSSARVVGTYNGWYQIQYGGGYGYISSKYTSSYAPSSSSSSGSSSYTPSVSGGSITSVAQSLLGRPYAYGGSGPNSFDCSGFTYYVYAQCGKSIPRTSAAQYANAAHISRSALQPGDLVFFASDSSGTIGHVAIYLGNNQIIHSANSDTGVCITSIDNGYYSGHYVGCGRY